jgi:hypothetical protein
MKYKIRIYFEPFGSGSIEVDQCREGWAWGFASIEIWQFLGRMPK